MPIYIGGNKIKDIYLGSTKIGKVYKGSTLVYESGLNCYAYRYVSGSSSSEMVLIIGGIGTGYPYISIASTSSVQTKYTTGKITSITGTLGSSNSKIKTTYFPNNDYEYSYVDQITVNGHIIYIYGKVLSEIVSSRAQIWVLKGSTVNSQVLLATKQLTALDTINYPYSANSNSMKETSGGNTFERLSSADILWRV